MDFLVHYLRISKIIFSKICKKYLDTIQSCILLFERKFLKVQPMIKPAYKYYKQFEGALSHYTPYTLISSVFLAIILIFVIKKIGDFIIKFIKFMSNFKVNMLILFTYLPPIQKKLKKAAEETKVEVQKMFPASYKKLEFFDNPQSEGTILNKLGSMFDKDKPLLTGGKLTGSVYCSDQKIHNVAAHAYDIYSYSNLLHPDLFKSAKFINAELINIGLDLFHGKPGSCGLITSGGTMSIIHSMWGYINKKRKEGIERPQIIAPVTIHAAFDKAAEMFYADLIKVPLDKNYKINLKIAESYICEKTACIAGSAPNFPHCIMDDIEGLNKLAIKYNVPLHVDCCLGGFLTAFYEKANLEIPPFDFRLKGVTSISADLHKYGNCPKGISLLLYKNHEIRRNVFFIYPHWMGGLYLTPVIDGSRTGGIIASSYAILCYLGKQYYCNIATKINNAVYKLKTFIKNKCPLLKVIGDPFICGVSFTGEKIEYFYDGLERKGWHVNYIQAPYGIGFIFTSANVDYVDNLINDIKDIHQDISNGKLQPLGTTAKIYGAALPLPAEVSRISLEMVGDVFAD